MLNTYGKFLSTVALFGMLTLMSGCVIAPSVATSQSLPSRADRTEIAQFSAGIVSAPPPQQWQPWIISRFNRRTDYRIVELDGARVLKAHSMQAASGLLQEIVANPVETPYLRWQWKVPQLLSGADLSTRGVDDSPVRIIVSFDGDREKLDVEDRAMASMVKLFSGREMPYATLMYVWDNKLPVDVMLNNAYSNRAKMIVVESGAARTGQWLNFRRDLVSDFRRAFGEEPGKIISIGVMTDSNRTETEAIAYYGDIALDSAKQ
jgi:Protein of unknown function (DUF3047)